MATKGDDVTACNSIRFSKFPVIFPCSQGKRFCKRGRQPSSDWLVRA